MGSRYPNEFRMEVLKEIHAEEMSICKIADIYGISRGTLYDWLVKEKEGTLFEDNRHNAGRHPSTDTEEIIQYVRENPDAFQYEIAKMCNTSQFTVWRCLKSHGFTRKKKEKKYKESDRDQRNEYERQLSDLSHLNIVYTDESGVETITHRDYAYTLKGKKVTNEISGKRYSRTSIISGLTEENQLIAPMIFTGSSNTNVVLTWVKDILIPNLTEKSVIIFDNASFHKSPKIRQAIESAGHIMLFLPPYSPDLNPIEHLWKAIKQNLNYYYDIYRSFFQNLCLQINLLSN